MVKFSLEQRLDTVRRLRGEGHNCAQCVAMAFSDVTDIAPETLAAIAHGFGGGIGGRQQLCGAVSGMTMVSGLVTPLADRRLAYASAARASEEFERVEGSSICRELKQMGKPCGQLIEDAVVILHTQLFGQQSDE